MVAWVGYEPAIQVLTHDADLVAVLIHIRGAFDTVIALQLFCRPMMRKCSAQVAFAYAA